MNDAKIIRQAALVKYLMGMALRCRVYGTRLECDVADTVIKQATWVSEDQWYVLAAGANRKPTSVGGPYQHPDEMNSRGGWYCD